METVRLGSDLPEISRIGLGTWAIGGWMWGGTDQRDAVRTIHAALDQGITLIDTAPAYGFGRAEEIVGQALAGNGLRDRVVIATKVGLAWRHGKVFRNASPRRIRTEIEASLRRLRTDTIDLYQVHWPDPTTELERTAAALERLRQAGKIRAIGLSNFSPAQIEQFRRVAPVVAVQPPYNLFERGAEADVLPYAAQHELAVLAYGALCRGLLTGRVTAATSFPPGDLRRDDLKFQPPRRDQYLAAVAALQRFGRERYGKDVLALAVRWVLDRGRTIALWGARRPEQLDPIASTMGWSIDPAGMAEIDRILERTITDPIGPEFMAPPSRSRHPSDGVIVSLPH